MAFVKNMIWNENLLVGTTIRSSNFVHACIIFDKGSICFILKISGIPSRVALYLLVPIFQGSRLAPGICSLAKMEVAWIEAEMPGQLNNQNQQWLNSDGCRCRFWPKLNIFSFQIFFSRWLLWSWKKCGDHRQPQTQWAAKDRESNWRKWELDACELCLHWPVCWAQ